MVKSLLEDIGNFPDHGRGLARSSGCDEQVVVFEADASLALLLGKRKSPKVGEEFLELLHLVKNEIFIVATADAGVSEHRKRGWQIAS